MLGLRWGAVQASLAGYLAALLIAVLYFKGGVRLLEYAHLKALMSSLDVLLIIWAAFLFYRVTDEAGAVKQIGEALPHLTADRGMQALVIGWGFAAFLQGVGGFGVPVAVVAPILLGIVMGGVQLFIATYGPWNTASFIGGMAGLVVSFGLARFHRGTQNNTGSLGLKSLGVAVSGYAVLVMITAIILLIPVVKGLLGGVVIRVSNPELSTGLGYIHQTGGKSISLLNHAGAILFYAAILVYLIYKIAGRYQPGAFGSILTGTIKRVWSPSVSIILMLCMATVMEFSGMTDALARGLADLAGGFFPFVAPWIGALGAFMTGSNTNSNVVFALLQLRTAQLLGYSAVIILAGQTSAAGLASVVAPAKIVVGTSTADLAGREGEVMRKMLPYIIILVLLISLLTSIGVLTGT
jgi:lactate permease